MTRYSAEKKRIRAYAAEHGLSYTQAMREMREKGLIPKERKA